MIQKKDFLTMNRSRFVLVLSLLVWSTLSIGAPQEATPTVADSTEVNIIPQERIPLASGETIIKISRLAESMISDERIEMLRVRNDSILKRIDSLLLIEKSQDLSAVSDRYLDNLLTFWYQKRNVIEGEKQKLSGIISGLYDKQNLLNKELRLWVNTRESIDPASSTSAFRDIFTKVPGAIDSVSNIATRKTNDLLQILNMTSNRGIETENFINKVKGLLKERQASLFKKSHPSVFGIDYGDKSQWQAGKHIKLFYQTDGFLLREYFRNNTGAFYFYFAFLVVLIALFYYLRIHVNNLGSIDTTFYQESLKKILSRPVSAALTLGIFSSILFFANRPQLFIDISILVVCLPLFLIVITMDDRIKKKYIVGLGFLIIFRFISYFLPPEIVIHRLTLLVIIFIETYLLLSLNKIFKVPVLKSRFIQGLTRLTIIIHLLITAIGFIALVNGSIALADMAVKMIISNAFVGILLYVSATIIIGLVQYMIDGSYLRKLNFIRSNHFYLKRKTATIIITVAVLFWISSILRWTGVYDEFMDFLTGIMEKEYHIGSASFSFGSILLFFIVIWLSVMISKIIRVILDEDVLVKVSLKKGVPRLISVMTRYSIVAIGVFLAVSAAGMPLDSLTIIFGAFSVGIGFGLQNIFNNLVSGLILLFERPIQIGDVVEVGSLIGNVKSMGIRSSNLRTFDGAEVIVPNGHLISNEVINWTLSDKKRRIEIFSGVAYGSDVHKVHALFMQLLKEHPDILDDPEPKVYFNDLGESSLDFRLLFWTDNIDEWLRIRSEIVFRIHDVLYEEGITIPFPQRDLHIRSIHGKLDIKPDK